jgi:hypothetical protein
MMDRIGIFLLFLKRWSQKVLRFFFIVLTHSSHTPFYHGSFILTWFSYGILKFFVSKHAFLCLWAHFGCRGGRSSYHSLIRTGFRHGDGAKILQRCNVSVSIQLLAEICCTGDLKCAPILWHLRGYRSLDLTQCSVLQFSRP